MMLRDSHTSLAAAWLTLLLAMILTACGGGSAAVPAGGGTESAAPQNIGSAGVPLANTSTWPVGLPADGVQPWEQVDSNGYVIPASGGTESAAPLDQGSIGIGSAGIPPARMRNSSAITTTTDFTPGRERFNEGGSVSDLGEASSLSAGSGESAYAIYRVVMGGSQPGTVSIDANLQNAASAYWVGVSDYAAGSWDWHGPFTDSHVRLSLPAGDYLSPTGNLFVNVLAWDGAALDVVGVGVNARDGGDATAPPAPAMLTAIPISGGLRVEWTDSAAGDLAGYRLYWSYSPINDAKTGANSVPYLIGMTSHILAVPQGRRTYIRIAAVDTSGNESALSPDTYGLPGPGSAPQVTLATDTVSGPFGLSANLTASGADSYDWDLNGDGVFEITDDASGSQSVSITQAGIIRPAVVGHSGSGMGQARGAVSLIVSGNSRPVAQVTLSPQSGLAPLVVTYTGEAWDAEDGTTGLNYSWDINGDGVYVGSGGWNSLTPPDGTYPTPGTYNVKFRVTDTEGAWDVDTATVQVLVNTPPVAYLNAEHLRVPISFDGISDAVGFDASDSYDPEGSTLEFAFDPTGVGSFLPDPDNDGEYLFAYNDPGIYQASVRVTDSGGASSYASISIEVYPFASEQYTLTSGTGAYNDIIDANGRVGVAFRNATTFGLQYVSFSPGGGWDTLWTIDASFSMYPSLARVGSSGSNIGCAFYQSDLDALLYAYSSDRHGNGWNLPVTVDDTTSGNLGQYASLVMLADFPAISYHDQANGNLMFVRASSSSGSTWNLPVTLDDGGGDDVGEYTSMIANAFGYPMIAYFDHSNHDIKLIRSQNTDGSTWLPPQTIVDTANILEDIHLLLLANGHPAIAYWDASDEKVQFIKASESSGAVWQEFPQTVASGEGVMDGHLGAVVVDGRPVLSWSTNQDLRIGMSANATGSGWYKFYADSGSTVTHDVGEYSAVADINGRPYVAHFDDENDRLRLTFGVAP